ncbi:MAG: pyridoxal phosphate-dependent aminotransferase [Bryobacteraceae bacterium]|jgi:DNA-binding transcriptional MocR family regulator
MDIRFSGFGRASTHPSPVNAMMAAFVGDFRDGVDIDLGVGYVNEKTIPAALLAQALEAVAGDNTTYRQAFNYGGPDGSPNLIAALRRFLGRRRIGGLDEATLSRKQLIIGPCGATSILDALAEVLAPGIVVTSDPMYYIYCNCLERKGFEVLAVPEDGEGINLAMLEAKLEGLGARAADIAFFYVVTVNNPSCTILSNARRRALYDVAARCSRRQGRRIPIVFDLAYELLLHDPRGQAFESALGRDRLDIAYEIGTLSKVLAPAMRIGYLLGPGGPLMNAMVQKTSDTGFSAPVFVQEMAAFMLDRHIEPQLRAVNAGYREKAVAVRAAIERELGPYLEDIRGGHAGFYYYLTFAGIETHTASAFFRFLTRTTGNPAVDGPPGRRLPRVMYIPGEYCVHPRGDLAEAGRRQWRLSYGFEDVERILRALELMRAAVEFARSRETAGVAS